MRSGSLRLLWWVFPLVVGWGLAATSRLPERGAQGADSPDSGPQSLRDVSRRSSGELQQEGSAESSCSNRSGSESNLAKNTHQYNFEDLSGLVSLAWVGDGTGILLALTTFQVPLRWITFGQSKLYRSEDYGKTFSDITHLINNTFIRTEFGIAIGPENSGKVILTGDVSGGSLGGRIFRSLDFGKHFIRTDLPFHPLTQISYHPKNFSILLALSIKNTLWLSSNFGETWTNLHDFVCLVKWGHGDMIYFTTHTNKTCYRGQLELRKTTDFGKTFETIGSKIYSFGIGGRFLFASVMTGKENLRMIQVSVDEGESWNIAQLPPVGHEQFYSILAANDDMVFMHVDEPGDTGFGTIYTSDDRGVVYSKSLERHLYTTTGGETDFTNVTSLRGVYITSVLSEADESVQSVISFDQGGEWKPLRKPDNAVCDSTAKNKDECSLHIHASYSIAQKVNVPMLPLSEPNAIGLIIAHGSVGDAISIMKPDVYVSDDGGYSWMKVLAGPHHYAILDSGGLIVAVEHSQLPISVIKYSTDEGQCWYSYKFTSEPVYFTGLASEPGAKSMNVSIWGYKKGLLALYWISITIDFEELLTRDCQDEDYTKWLAHSSDLNDPSDGCILGYKEQYRRLRKAAVCRNGRGYIVVKQPSVCICTLADFLCDFGYYRPENQSECIEQLDLKGHDLEFCLHGKQELLLTSGYRKIPGDKCEGGAMPSRTVKDMRTKCTSNPMEPSQLSKNSSSNSALIIVAVVLLLVIATIGGVLFIKKYVCGGRFLVHRYSVLQQHADANGIDIADELDATLSSRGKSNYHDDSDEDLLE
ncbi:sortilin isoform X3 [Latimeria chalumnae]|uniref:sortilin isoform X3 n=1 Tax=Latimeria chalumnae TaxID=7897 RepID=UPI0006D900C7|nr:PREDICTED: sortilin isoform X3 [Latimeria chalumnae]|eukprot:XP_014341443.1 PREDICTED: sortilin isoform X3 [Latimeria chalumnae]